ncbi:MAG: BatD family protein, partial [Pseudomonadales bacterium]
MSGRARPWRLIAAVLAGLLLAPAAAAELRATIEPRIIDELDTTRLTIRATGSNQTTPLALDALDPDFEVLNTRSSSQYRSVNGRVESWVEYQVVLRPRRAGELTIPPIAVGNEVTEPITLQVRSLSPALKDAIDRLVFFETELTVDPVYVQAQTVLIRRLYYASGAQIYSDLPGMPEVDGAVVTPLGETVSSTSIRDGQRYGVIEQRFALFPERSGELTIPAIAVTSSVRLQTDGRTRRSGVRIATEPLTLTVLPIPPEYPSDQPWLPAESVTLSDVWTPDDGRLHVGEPLTRTVRADVVGNGSSVIAPLRAALPESNFRTYPEPARRADDASGATVRGSRSETYALMPTAPGRVVLPGVEVTWWDVKQHRLRTATVPGRRLTITGSAVADATAGAEPAADPESPAAGSPIPTAPADAGSDPDATAPAGWLPVLHGGWLAGAIAVLLLALAGYWGFGPGGRWRHRVRGRRAPAGPGARRRLRAACATQEPAAMYRALLAWLADHYGTSQHQAANAFRQAGHGDLLDRLAAAAYRPGSVAAPVSGREVLGSV